MCREQKERRTRKVRSVPNRHYSAGAERYATPNPAGRCCKPIIHGCRLN